MAAGYRMKNTLKAGLAALVLAFTLLVTSGGVSFAQDFQKGLEAAQKGDFATALREWGPLAQQGNAQAQYNLGWQYDAGLIVTQDYKEAVKWYRKSAEQGNAQAQHGLGWVYTNGAGVIQDYKEAVKWYRKSAEQGYAAAQTGLGLMYHRGQGVIQDDVYAHMWFNIAASLGGVMSTWYRDRVAERMTASDISKAQKLARECVRKNYKGC